MYKSIKQVSSIILGLIIIILINIPIIGANEDQLALYQNKKYQIEALYPKSWEIAEETFGVQVMFISPFENSDDKFRENVNIVIKELEQTAADLEAISQASIEQISQLITDFKLISYEKVQFSGYESRLIIYSGKHRWLRSPHTLGKILRSKRCHHSVCNQSKNHDCQREQSSQGFLICTHPKSQLKSLL